MNNPTQAGMKAAAVAAAVVGAALVLNNVTAPNATAPRVIASAAFLPDPKLTPGAVDPRLTEAVLRAPGFTTSSYRDVPDSEKAKVYAEYGIGSHPAGEFEVDHLISLELGGSNELANLWPQS